MTDKKLIFVVEKLIPMDQIERTKATYRAMIENVNDKPEFADVLNAMKKYNDETNAEYWEGVRRCAFLDFARQERTRMEAEETGERFRIVSTLIDADAQFVGGYQIEQIIE